MREQLAYCSYFDRNYLPKGLAMINSLLKYENYAKIIILCLDTYTHYILQKLNIKNIEILSLEEFEDKELKSAKKNRTIFEYYLTCTPSLPLFIFKKFPNIKKIFYLDADLLFFSSPKTALKELGQKSIFTVEHRFPPSQKSRIYTSGRFNVGFQIFSKDKEAINCLYKWRKQCLESCKINGDKKRFGDQLYLNDWPKFFKNLVISSNLGINAAPWNIKQYKITKRGDDVFINEDQLICYHFHQFEIINEHNFEYSPCYNLSTKVIEYIYQPYVGEIKKQIATIKKIDKNYDIKINKKNILIKIRGQTIKRFGQIYWQFQSILK